MDRSTGAVSLTDTCISSTSHATRIYECQKSIERYQRYTTSFRYKMAMNRVLPGIDSLIIDTQRIIRFIFEVFQCSTFARVILTGLGLGSYVRTYL
jgi:hypothetical protein